MQHTGMVRTYFETVHVTKHKINLLDLTHRDFESKLFYEAGFDMHEATAIYHEHIAPLNEVQRLVFYSKVITGVIHKSNINGKRLLATSRGL